MRSLPLVVERNESRIIARGISEREMSEIITKSEQRTLQVRQHKVAGRVVLLIDGHYLCDMPWQSVDEYARVLKGAARMAENVESAEKQVLDQAVLLRAGMPVGLSNDKRVFDEAKKEAVHNRELRRSNLKLADELPVLRENFGIPRVRNEGV